MQTSGMDLKLRRIAANVTQRALAKELGVRPQAVSAWEQRAIVRQSTASRYLAALAAVANGETPWTEAELRAAFGDR